MVKSEFLWKYKKLATERVNISTIFFLSTKKESISVSSGAPTFPLNSSYFFSVRVVSDRSARSEIKIYGVSDGARVLMENRISSRSPSDNPDKVDEKEKKKTRDNFSSKSEREGAKKERIRSN